MTKHHVANIGDVAPGKQIIVTVNEKQIGIFFEKGQYYAVLNVCPHAFAPICQGRIEAPLMADAVGLELTARYRRDTSRTILRCPWHHWEFDLETGKAVCNVRQHLKMYPVHVDGDRILVEV